MLTHLTTNDERAEAAKHIYWQCYREGREAGTNSRGPTMLLKYFSLSLSSINTCELYKLTLSDQAQIILQLGVSISD